MSRKTIPAGETRPGSRYLTKKDVLIQMACAPKGLVYSSDKTQVMFYQVVDGQAVRTKYYPIELFYPLRPASGGRRGRPAYSDKTWRGWAWKFPDLPEALIAKAVAAGYYSAERTNYFMLGKEGRARFALYRNGVLGIKSKAAAELLEAQGFYIVDTGMDFFPLRFKLSAVVKAKEFLDLFDHLLVELGE